MKVEQYERWEKTQKGREGTVISMSNIRSH